MDEIATRRLAELRKSVSQMTDEELYAHIGASRNNRHRPPEKKVKAKAKSTSSSKSKKSDVDKALEGITPEQAAELLKQLKG